MTKNLFKDVRMDEFHPEFKNAKKIRAVIPKK